MKSNLLLTSLLTLALCASIRAQTVIVDFEAAETTSLFQYFGSPLDGTTNSVIANPDATGINTSSMVGDFIKPAGAETWAGAFSQALPMSIDLTSDTEVCVDVWFSNPGNLALKIENGDQPNWIRTLEVTETEQWVQLCFNTVEPSIEDPFAGAAGGIYATAVLFFDFGISPAEETTYYFDNITTKEGNTEPVDIMFSVDMNSYPDPFTTVFVSGTFNGWSADSNPLSDDDNDGIWSGTVPDISTGGHEYKFQLDQWAVQEQLLNAPCTKVDPTGEFINRYLVAANDDTIPTVCYESCFLCGEGVAITINLGQGGITVSDEGLFIAGGGNFGGPGDYPLFDFDSDGVHTITLERQRGFASHYTFTNGACGDFSCKENIAGQDCADPDSFNDRFMGPISQDTVIGTCFGECTTTTECGNTSAAMITFSVDMNDYSDAFTGVFVSGSFNNWSGNGNPLADADGDGVWSANVEILAGTYEYKFQLDEWSVEESFLDGDPCTVTDPSGQFVNRPLEVASEDLSICYLWNTCDECESSGLGSLEVDNSIFEVKPTIVQSEAVVTFSQPFSGDKQLSVYSALGQLMTTQDVGTGTSGVNLNLQGFVPGVYLVNVRTEGKQQTVRVLVSE